MLVVVYCNATVSLPAVESLFSKAAERVTPTEPLLSLKVSSYDTAVVDALTTS